MFKNEYDKIGARLAPNDPATIKNNSGNSVNQWTVDTDATAGTLTVNFVPRLGKTPEPMYEPDGVTPVVLNLANPKRTILSAAAIKELQIVAAGMNGTFYAVNASGGDY